MDWLCLPRFDSPACFAALLGGDEHGRWLLAPAGDYTVKRTYVGDTALLETTFTTATGTLTLTDLVRQVRGVAGTVLVRHEWVVRFDYGEVRPWVSRHHDGDDHAIVAVAGPDMLVLRGPRLPVAVDGRHADEFEVHEGDELTFTTTWVPSWNAVPPPG